MATSAKKTSAVKSGPAKKPVSTKAKIIEKSAKEPAKKLVASNGSSKGKAKLSPSKLPPSKAGAKPAPAVASMSQVAPRLTVRAPEGADALKQKIGALATATSQIRNYKRALQKSFFDIGLILKDIDEQKLYEVKGYGSFEAFLEREIDLGKQLGLKLSRAVHVFQRDAALAAGLDRVSAAIAVLDGEVDASSTPTAGAPSSSGGARSPIPFHKL